MDSLILRYSNSESPTIKSHEKIITDKGSVWWGWWKKTHETFRSSALKRTKDILTRKTIEIGLVCRKGVEEYYAATCSACEFGSGEPIPTPDVVLTPTYYSTQPLPAWFKFTNFRPLSRTEFEKNFGPVPDLDATLYEVEWNKERTSVSSIPKPAWDLKPIDAPHGDSILHISDLHFGKDHGYPTAPALGGDVTQRPLYEIIAATVRDNNIGVAAVVVSGDLVTEGNAGDYVYAGQFLEKLMDELSLPRQHCVIVPGNHDLWRIGLEHPTREYAHEAAFRNFVRSFYAADITELESLRRIRTASGYDLIFVSLNSSRVYKDALKNYGYIDRHRYQKLLDYLQTIHSEPGIATRQLLTFAVFHHHLIPVTGIEVPTAEEPVSIVLDAGDVIEAFCDGNIGYVLHGHQHIPFAGKVEKFNRITRRTALRGRNQPLQIISCGSSGVTKTRLPNSVNKNAFGVYTPASGGLKVQFFGYLPDVEPTVLWGGKVPLQRYRVK